MALQSGLNIRGFRTAEIHLMNPARPRRTLLITGAIVAWVLAAVLSAAADGPVARWVHSSGLEAKGPHGSPHYEISLFAKSPGNFLFSTLPLAIGFGLWHSRRVEASIQFLGSASAVGILDTLLKWGTGRHRPIKGIDPFSFTPFEGGFRGILAPNLTFPSGHTMLAFAMATSVCLLVEARGAWVIAYGIGIVVGLERVTENAHYVSDVVVGAGCGVVVAIGIGRLLNRGRRTVTVECLPVPP